MFGRATIRLGMAHILVIIIINQVRWVKFIPSHVQFVSKFNGENAKRH